jgi:xylulose-5-phosphate/fructose-6-phosphate phosphoketolase
MNKKLPQGRLKQLQAYLRAANYLGAAQLYLKENALLQEPLKPEHIKPRLLGHWGTQPGLNLIYTHLNRLIQDTNASVLLIVGPGHGAPAILANLYLEGTLSEYYPDLSQNLFGLNHLMRQFSWPGKMPSHLTPLTPGAIHEGGELGYSLVHAFGAAFDNPDLIVACIVGDGEAETGPLAAAWHSNKFLNPATDGAVLPILHLNGYKLSGPTIFARMSDEELKSLFSGYGYRVSLVDSTNPQVVHTAMWAALDWAYSDIRRIQEQAQKNGSFVCPTWPMIILRTPKGWTGPKSLDGVLIEGTFHSHQLPITDPATNPEHLKALEAWLRSYRPEALFNVSSGGSMPQVTAICPSGDKRMGKNLHANGGERLLPLQLPNYVDYAVSVPSPGMTKAEGTRELGKYLRDVFIENELARNFRFFCPDETISNRLNHIFEATARVFLWPLADTDEYLSRSGRVMEILSEHTCQGWLEGYLLSGRHGLFVTKHLSLLWILWLINMPSGLRYLVKSHGANQLPRSTICLPPILGTRIIMVIATRVLAS